MFRGLGAGGAPPAPLDVARPEGVLTLSAFEVAAYSRLFLALDSDSDGAIGGQQGALFLRRSKLANEVLREVWRAACGGTSKASLNKEEWFAACALVAATQASKSVSPSMADVVGASSSTRPLADFHYDTFAVVQDSEAPALDATSTRVALGTPTMHGSGLDKHIKYAVSTTTVLPHFPRKEMTVWRRYSDFEWLHQRLSTVYPAAVIPMFPGKKFMGNKDDEFVRERMAALTTYINKVVRHPLLSASFDLLLFLDATEPGLQAARDYLAANTTTAEESDSLLSRMGDAMLSLTSRDAAPAAIRTDEAYISGCASHAAVLARLQQVANAGAAVETNAADLSEALRSVATAMSALAAHERAHASSGVTAAAAVAAAAAASKRAQEALLAGKGSAAMQAASSFASAPPAYTGAPTSAAASAFASHMAAAHVDTSSVSAMFEANFEDVHSAHHFVAPSTTAPTKAAAPPAAAALAEGTADLLQCFGSHFDAMSARTADNSRDTLNPFLTAIKNEKDNAEELQEAIRRRDDVIERLQQANASLQRKKRTMAGLKPGAADFHVRQAAAQKAIDVAEAQLAERRQELDGVTNVLQKEMTRYAAARRRTALLAMSEYAQMQTVRAQEEANAWRSMISAASSDPAVIATSVAAVQEVSARAQLQARKLVEAVEGSSAAALLNENFSSAQAAFAESEPIPEAAEL